MCFLCYHILSAKFGFLLELVISTNRAEKTLQGKITLDTPKTAQQGVL